MNKILLLPLLFIAYTENTTAENINKIIDLSQKSIEELLYLSGKKHLPACFYSEDNFRGRYYCLAAPEMIDLYNIEDKHLNDQISSIDIPKGVQVTIYENDNFNSPYYNLSE
ncbi:peptidase inhibitor family I36 protein [Yersinia frederiksenii]|uniref:peptidase inhibitor family I36 protein n=2 Tax=Yersinia frederiksenii TaxID=29484 RepID=UPI00067BB949|nr:peptidase inhibitor family I36 protein [Yersinia frederiksenii]